MPRCEPIRDAKGRFAGCKPGTGGSSGGGSSGGGGPGGGGRSRATKSGGGLTAQKVSDLQQLAKKEGIDINTLSHKARRSVLISAIEANRKGKNLREEGLLKPTKTSFLRSKKEESKTESKTTKKPNNPLTNYEAIAQLGQDFVSKNGKRIDKTIADVNNLNLQLKAILPLMQKASGSKRIALNEKLQAIAKKRDDKQASLEKEFQGLRDKLGKTTPLTKEQAKTLAQTTKINIKKDEAREAVRQQLIDFYYVTGGKGSSSISVIEAKSPRAFANPGQGLVDISKKPNKRIVWHELGHHAEAENPRIVQASKDFRGSRATTAEPEKLSKIMNQSAYKDSEIAVRGNFIDPYVGKVYKDSATGKERNATEVFSMGIETFNSPKDMAAFYSQDKGHFNFILGNLLNF